jgi:hypothetical protein
MFDLGRRGSGRRLGAVGRWILATATLAGVAAAAPKPPMITVGKALTNRPKSCANRVWPNWSGAGGVGAASSLRTSLAPFAPAQGLFQHQFTATQLSDDGVRVNFEVVGGVKQTFAIRGHVVDLMYDAEENDEGSK